MLIAIAMVAVGIDHFAQPDFFVRIVPAWLPAPLWLVWISGFFEVLGGVGMLVPRVRRQASWGLIALYVAVFPANINMALHPELGQGIATWLLYARLPLQPIFVALVWWAGREGEAGR